MSLYGNVTTSDTTSSKGQGSLLWIPYLGIALLCLVFLAINFWCYHRKHRIRYQRKAEVIETRERVMERRILLNLIKARHIVMYGQDDSDSNSVNSCTVLARRSSCDRHDSNGIVDL